MCMHNSTQVAVTVWISDSINLHITYSQGLAMLTTDSPTNTESDVKTEAVSD